VAVDQEVRVSDDPLISLYDTFTEFRIPNERQMWRARWVMDGGAYKAIRAAGGGDPDDSDPGTWVPSPDETMFGVPITVTENGGQSHLELRDLMEMAAASGLLEEDADGCE
jgi:hypothetical protein